MLTNLKMTKLDECGQRWTPKENWSHAEASSILYLWWSHRIWRETFQDNATHWHQLSTCGSYCFGRLTTFTSTLTSWATRIIFNSGTENSRKCVEKRVTLFHFRLSPRDWNCSKTNSVRRLRMTWHQLVRPWILQTCRKTCRILPVEYF